MTDNRRTADIVLLIVTWGLHVVVWYLPDPARSERAAALMWSSLLWLWLLLWVTVVVATAVNATKISPRKRGGSVSRLIVRTTLWTVCYGQASAIAVVRFNWVLIEQLRFIDVVAAMLTVIAAVAVPFTTLVGVLLGYNAKHAANRDRAESGDAQ